jgi:peptidoglycan/LPS O-acetylase OafA/YrhL
MPFYLYRALRLLPAYLLVMLVYEVSALTVGWGRSLNSLPYVFFYQHTDLIFGYEEIFPRIHSLIPYWSLILEEHYYMLWGLFFCTLAYARLRITPVTIGAVVLMLCGAMLLRKLGVFWWTLPARFDGFLLGSISGIVVFMPRKVEISSRWRNGLLWAGFFVAAAALLRLLWSCRLSYRVDLAIYNRGQWLDVTCFSIVSVVLVLGMVMIDTRRIHLGRLQNWCAFIGLVSYEIYLTHFPLIVFLKRVFGFGSEDGKVTLFLVVMALSTVIAHLMHRTLTAPALKKRESILAFFEKRFSNGSRVTARTAATGAATVGPIASGACEVGEIAPRPEIAE